MAENEGERKREGRFVDILTTSTGNDYNTWTTPVLLEEMSGNCCCDEFANHLVVLRFSQTASQKVISLSLNINL